MTDYKIKSNKYSKLYQAPDVIAVPMGAFFRTLQRITGYKHPPEEREIMLENLPEPEFKINTKKDD